MASVAKKFRALTEQAISFTVTIKDTVIGQGPYKMLLIGETGSGKTSFLNLLWNCGEVERLATFDFENFRSNNRIDLENARSQSMESKTTGATSYEIKLGQLDLTLIDTPGFGDSRGMDEDKKHVVKIIDALKEETYINCVCLVVNGRQSRATATLQYVLNEITAILPNSIVDQIIVVFTNTADPLDLNFDVQKLTEFFGKTIEDERYFIIENPYCKIEKAKQKGRKLGDDIIAKSLMKGFRETAETLQRMFETIQEYGQVHTKKFSELYQKKQDIEKEVLDMYVAYNNQTKVEKNIDEIEEELQAAIRKKTANKNFRSVSKITRHVRVNTSYHNTLCGAPNCYSICHEGCGLPKSMDKEQFWYCATIKSNGYCEERLCGHHYTYHFHDECKYIEVSEDKEYIDETTRAKFLAAKSEEEQKKIIQQQLQKQRDECSRKKQEISATLQVKIAEFQTIGLNRSYVKLMQSQLLLVREYIAGEKNLEGAASLKEIEKMLEKEIELVQGKL